MRRWAGKLGVDPYTTNERLAQELERVAKIDAIAGKGSSIVAPKIPGASYVEDVHKLVTEMDPHELRDHNLNRLLEIGVPAEKAESFLELASLTPTRQTLLLSSLESLEGVANRAVVIEQALTLETEPEALFFLESVVMAGWYHTSQTPLERMVGASGVPGALAKDGRIIVFSALDYAYWTEQGAPIVSDFMKLYEGLPGRPEAWFSGGASPRFIAVAESRGWTVRTGVRSLVLAATPDFLDPLAISSDRPVTDLAKLNEPGRLTYLREAEVWEEIDTASLDLGRGPGGLPYSAGATLDCSFVLPEHPIGGKTPKFLCRDDSGTVYKVKYGRANRELYGEIIGTRLLWALGFKTDQVERVAVRCAGCPEEPWRFMNPGFLARRPALNEGVHTFDSAIIESYFGVRMQARVEQGVDWKELLSKLSSDAERARLQDVHRQALTLLASFLQHADSKAENQTLMLRLRSRRRRRTERADLFEAHHLHRRHRLDPGRWLEPQPDWTGQGRLQWVEASPRMAQPRAVRSRRQRPPQCFASRHGDFRTCAGVPGGTTLRAEQGSTRRSVLPCGRRAARGLDERRRQAKASDAGGLGRIVPGQDPPDNRPYLSGLTAASPA